VLLERGLRARRHWWEARVHPGGFARECAAGEGLPCTFSAQVTWSSRAVHPTCTTSRNRSLLVRSVRQLPQLIRRSMTASKPFHSSGYLSQLAAAPTTSATIFMATVNEATTIPPPPYTPCHCASSIRDRPFLVRSSFSLHCGAPPPTSYVCLAASTAPSNSSFGEKTALHHLALPPKPKRLMWLL
jgi:hypothetical protein